MYIDPSGNICEPAAERIRAKVEAGQATRNEQKKLAAYDRHKERLEKGFPRTAKAQREAQLAVDIMNEMVGPNTRPAVSVITHEDGTVSVGYSGKSRQNDPFAQQLQNKLNKTYGKEFLKENGKEKYTVSSESIPLNLIKQPMKNGELIGNKPGECAEPKAINAASNNSSPIEGMDTRWRGEGSNPHPFTGTNADGAPVSPNQMEPCDTCKANMEVYKAYANRNKK